MRRYGTTGLRQKFRSRFDVGFDHFLAAQKHADAGNYAEAIEEHRRSTEQFKESGHPSAARRLQFAQEEISRLTALLAAETVGP